MQEEVFYSVRMRAAQGGPHESGGKHISGGERISTFSRIKDHINSLAEKALSHSRGTPDFMQIQFERIQEPIQKVKPLPLSTNKVESVAEGHSVAEQLLVESGVSVEVIQKSYKEITKYLDLRGAIVFDITTGQRIDNRNGRGVRVSRMDWMHENFKRWAHDHQMPPSERVKEALVLATKVCAHPATIAELCWSDDPDYTTGYVASRHLGYQRITKLKLVGDDRGCRVFFVDSLSDVSAYIEYLEKQPIFIQWEEEK